MNEDEISDNSEQIEERWGLEADDGKADLRGYDGKLWLASPDLDDDDSSMTEWSDGGEPAKKKRARSARNKAIEKGNKSDQEKIL